MHPNVWRTPYPSASTNRLSNSFGRIGPSAPKTLSFYCLRFADVRQPRRVARAARRTVRRTVRRTPPAVRRAAPAVRRAVRVTLRAVRRVVLVVLRTARRVVRVTLRAVRRPARPPGRAASPISSPLLAMLTSYRSDFEPPFIRLSRTDILR